jgi:stage V sporulation protein G
MIKIIDVRLLNLGNSLKAYVDIDYYGLLFSVRVVDSKNGLFVGMPREKGKDEKYYDVVHPANIDVKQALEDIVLPKYLEIKNKQVTQMPPLE